MEREKVRVLEREAERAERLKQREREAIERHERQDAERRASDERHERQDAERRASGSSRDRHRSREKYRLSRSKSPARLLKPCVVC